MDDIFLKAQQQGVSICVSAMFFCAPRVHDSWKTSQTDDRSCCSVFSQHLIASQRYHSVSKCCTPHFLWNTIACTNTNVSLNRRICRQYYFKLEKPRKTIGICCIAARFCRSQVRGCGAFWLTSFQGVTKQYTYNCSKRDCAEKSADVL